MPAEKSGGAAKRKRDQCCEVEAAAREFLGTLDISSVYFDPEFDRCYCDRCYEGSWPDTIVEEGPPHTLFHAGGSVSASRSSRVRGMKPWTSSGNGVCHSTVRRHPWYSKASFSAAVS